MNAFTYGTATVPDGRRGAWIIDTFTLSDAECMLPNLRARINHDPWMMLRAGTYRRLRHKERGVVMTNTPMEVRTSIDCYRSATGSVLINGLGLGMVLEGILTKPDVTSVRVIEIDPDVIALVAPHFKHDARVEIAQGDAFAYFPAPGERYDYVWHDVWDTICADNLPSMAKLTRRWARRAGAQGVWSRNEARIEQARYRRSSW